MSNRPKDDVCRMEMGDTFIEWHGDEDQVKSMVESCYNLRPADRPELLALLKEVRWLEAASIIGDDSFACALEEVYQARDACSHIGRDGDGVDKESEENGPRNTVGECRDGVRVSGRQKTDGDVSAGDTESQSSDLRDEDGEGAGSRRNGRMEAVAVEPDTSIEAVNCDGLPDTPHAPVAIPRGVQCPACESLAHVKGLEEANAKLQDQFNQALSLCDSFDNLQPGHLKSFNADMQWFMGNYRQEKWREENGRRVKRVRAHVKRVEKERDDLKAEMQGVIDCLPIECRVVASEGIAVSLAISVARLRKKAYENQFCTKCGYMTHPMPTPTDDATEDEDDGSDISRKVGFRVEADVQPEKCQEVRPETSEVGNSGGDLGAVDLASARQALDDTIKEEVERFGMVRHIQKFVDAERTIADALLKQKDERIAADTREINALVNWRADVTVSLQEEGGTLYVDVPEKVKALREQVERLKGALLRIGTTRISIKGAIEIADAALEEERE